MSRTWSGAAADRSVSRAVAWRVSLHELELELELGDYSLRDLSATVLELDARELANVNTEAELAVLTTG